MAPALAFDTGMRGPLTGGRVNLALSPGAERDIKEAMMGRDKTETLYAMAGGKGSGRVRSGGNAMVRGKDGGDSGKAGMKFVRIKMGDGSTYANMEGDEVRIIDGDIFGAWSFSGQRKPLSAVELLAPIERPPQLVAIGLNYYLHAEESGMARPGEPVVFLKGVNAVTGPGRPIVLPLVAPSEIDYEAELVIVIGRETKHVSREDAARYILGYTIGNDVSARDCQLRRDSQWARGKSFDTFAPMGPAIVTGINGDDLGITLWLNGNVMQQASTSDMIFSCGELVSFLSGCMTLYPGSVIMTGTPPGVGFTRSPPVFLKEGDTVTIEIEQIGKLTNPVVKERK